ncbi:MAG: hypothetical protein O6499_03955, partial [Candidatus Dadabacteria bacterium]|nr:hypothetical protein [Candidatus Dadabacteria bacterium]
MKAGTNECLLAFEESCNSTDDVFGGEDTTCSDEACSDVIMGCCVQNGTCTTSSEFDCNDDFTANANGCFDGTSCEEPPKKGCCVKDGTNVCVLELEASCMSSGDVFGGDDTTCSDQACTEKIDGCCEDRKKCTSSSEFDCLDTFTANANGCFDGKSCEEPPPT